MSAINAAWELIGDPAQRQAFDRGRATRGGGGATRRRARPTRRVAVRAAGRPPRRADRPRTAGPAAAPPQPRRRSRATGPRVGRSQGGGYDDSMRKAEGHGAAGPPPGRPSGTVLNFGRYAGWSLGEVARHDLEYVEWLDRAPIGRNYRAGDRRAPADLGADGRSAATEASRPARALPPALARASRQPTSTVGFTDRLTSGTASTGTPTTSPATPRRRGPRSAAKAMNPIGWPARPAMLATTTFADAPTIVAFPPRHAPRASDHHSGSIGRPRAPICWTTGIIVAVYGMLSMIADAMPDSHSRPIVVTVGRHRSGR